MKSTDADTSIHFGKVRKIALIGGSRLMIQVADMMREHGIGVVFVVAPRYASVGVGRNGETLLEIAQNSDAELIFVEDIRKDGHSIAACDADLALCFGPAWVFPGDVIDSFSKGMYNYNAIPQPRYVGGAHHSWQAMNGDFRGGCVIQAIGPNVDRGPILRAEFYDFPETVKTPADYGQVKDSHSLDFMKRFLVDLLSDTSFTLTSYDTWNAERLYFPRLMSKVHGWIDWRWPCEQLIRFINAFGEPYDGARTCLNGKVVRIAQVAVLSGFDVAPHPFCAGLVIRVEERRLVVATSFGLISVASVTEDDTNRMILNEVRDGARFYTHSETLDKAMRSSVQVQSNGNFDCLDPEA